MLPFLKARKLAGMIVSSRKADGTEEERHEEGQHTEELLNASEALIRAVHAKDAVAVADAMKSMYPEDGDDEPNDAA